MHTGASPLPHPSTCGGLLAESSPASCMRALWDHAVQVLCCSTWPLSPVLGPVVQIAGSVMLFSPLAPFAKGCRPIHLISEIVPFPSSGCFSAPCRPRPLLPTVPREQVLDASRPVCCAPHTSGGRSYTLRPEGRHGPDGSELTNPLLASQPRSPAVGAPALGASYQQHAGFTHS